MVELVEAGELAPKTVNNALTALSVALNDGAQQGLLAGNPCARVRQLPSAQAEKDYLRLHEITPYLDAAPSYYRSLAVFLIGSGARISEPVALRWEDLDLEEGLVRIVRQRARTGAGIAQTKISAPWTR